MFSLLQYRAFVAVADTQSVTAAAEQLRRSPSAISMIVAQLEDRLGAPLFDGGRKGRLTELGRFVLAQARTLVEHDDRVSRSIRSFADGQIGRVDVACIPSISNVFLPDTLYSLWSKNPSMTFNVRDMDSRSVVEAVVGERCEIGVGTAVDIGEELNFDPVFDDAIDVVCGAKDELTRRNRPLAWSDLAGRRFLGNSSYSLVTSPELKDLAHRQAAYVPNITPLLAMVRGGGSITLLPRINHLHAGSGIAFVPLHDPLLRRRVGFLTRAGRTLSPGAQSFLVALRASIARKSKTVEIEMTGADGKDRAAPKRRRNVHAA